MIDWPFLRSLLPSLAAGAVFSVVFTVGVCLCGGVLAVFISYFSCNGSRALRSALSILSMIVRGFPLLVLLYLIYYGLGTVGFVRNTVLWSAFSSPLFCAVLAFSFNHGFFIAQILTGALASLHKGMIEASYSLGMGRITTFRTIQLPLAARSCLPAYRNEVVAYFKASSLVSVLTLTDLLSVAKTAVDESYDPITPFLGAAAFYWSIIQIIQFGFDHLENHWRISER